MVFRNHEEEAAAAALLEEIAKGIRRGNRVDQYSTNLGPFAVDGPVMATVEVSIEYDHQIGEAVDEYFGTVNGLEKTR